jgi:membrane protein YqaA with SNARE-associated domain
VLPTLDLSSPALALWSAALLGFLVGIVPIGLAEALALAIGAVRPPRLALAMLLLFTAAHVAAKALWYGVGALSDRIEHPRGRRWIAQAREYLAQHPAYGFGVLGVSAVASVPPFHLAAIAAGITRMPFGRVVLVCLAGRLLRFGLLASASGLFAGWLATR